MEITAESEDAFDFIPVENRSYLQIETITTDQKKQVPEEESSDDDIDFGEQA